MLNKSRLTIIILSLLLTTTLYAQEKSNLFTYSTVERSSLSNTANEWLNNIESAKQVKSVRLIEILELQSQANKQSISINLPNGNTLNFLNTSAKSIKEGYHYWKGVDEENSASFSFVISENDLTGMIRAKGIMFDISALPNTRYHILKEIDSSELDNELAPIEVENNGSDTSEKHSNTSQKIMTPTINILVAYTTAAKNNHSGNIESSIVLAEGNLENSFSNSGINADVDVVHTMEVSYSASSTSLLNLCRLTTSQTFTAGYDCSVYSSSNLQGYMDVIHNKRYNYDAQVVVLITDAGGPGIGWLKSNTKYAFSVAREDRFVSTYTMAHEIGHNIGAQHNKSEDQNPYYSYGHGYNYNPANWSTIMAYPPTGSTRINHFSNPDETFAGVATGTASDEDNARVWDNRASVVSAFDPPPTLPEVSISGPTTVNINDTETWYSNRTGGVSPFSYSWYSSTNGGSSWNLIGTSANYTGSFSTATTTKLKVVVTDDNSETDQDIMDVIVTDGGCIMCKSVNQPQEFALNQNYPNPFNPSTQIKYALPEQADVSIRVYNIMGQQVATLVNTNMSAGFHEVNFEAGNLASGVYLTRMEAVGKSGEQFSEELKMQLIK